ncbi:hypothetical protein COCC4DRAFT_33955 [Bipolaris maydis ATCC 48331]|uniref:Cyanovirin-N domain-containing protein n=2 Tax=Cochliobolus heterostrophus TaxID=5016 RepID=M2UGI9_COCH5|nr:uncharacterized protein COCC4DRAFT_33955 [Bipolaris maydis ATCC 48331]EMD97559.1 hypothetical protein COCHEDRAFT_1018992 [Bipolaris maydis C5]KAH7557904.1 hypothetical protein BM1_05176 [Bipolaris maydis]ENI01303.1 hypothetical protein COCC4DRAFT_33955 [Bipolaris maydis ATCC 48331]KAJ5030996.1 hypothetical protein J3E73DRAFT_263314 [Bipolaris maydis]KAJ5046973.1 hypothetical protein J3E74DRAFT_391832 [Bipolaris maydis]
MAIAYYLLGLAAIAHSTNNMNDSVWMPGSPCPTSITTYIGTSGGDWCEIEPDWPPCRFPNTTVIHNALVHCYGVKTLDIGFEVGGCTGPEVDRWNLPIKLLGEGQKYPPLERLILDGYSFGGLWERKEEQEEPADLKLYGDEWDDYEAHWNPNEYIDEKNARVEEERARSGESKTNLDMWIEAMDWSQLKELSINTRRSEMAEASSKLPQLLISLKSLNLTSLAFIRGLKEHTLKNLKWVGRTKKGQLEHILQLQGKSLRSVEYRCNEASCSDWPQHVNISTIGELAPQLQHISLNMPRVNGTWPLKELETLASIPSLTSMELYFRLQSDCELYGQYLSNCYSCGNAYREWKHENWKTGHCQGEKRYASPLLNSTTVQEMFAYLRFNKVGAELKEITFKAGDWGELYDGPLRLERFLDGKRVKIVCKSDSRNNTCDQEEQ